MSILGYDQSVSRVWISSPNSLRFFSSGVFSISILKNFVPSPFPTAMSTRVWCAANTFKVCSFDLLFISIRFGIFGRSGTEIVCLHTQCRSRTSRLHQPSFVAILLFTGQLWNSRFFAGWYQSRTNLIEIFHVTVSRVLVRIESNVFQGTDWTIR